MAKLFSKEQVKTFFCALVFLCLIVSCSYADVAVNEANFPDPNFRKYVNEVFALNSGTIPDYLLQSTTTVSVMGMNISSLKGIEYFTQVKYLYCLSNDLSELDLSNNKDLVSLYCNYNKLNELNISNNTEYASYNSPSKNK